MKRLDWSSLDAAGREAALARPPASIGGEVRAGARRIIDQVRADGDHALRALTRRFDGVEIDAITLTADEIEAGAAQVGAELAAAIDAAAARIEAFHAAGRVPDYGVDTAPGVRCERVARPIRRVGLYVPAGSAPLPSTALMLGVPARLAGCPEITLASPPDREGRVDAAVLHVARRLGIGRVARVGGAQAIAALAYGTASLPRCDKLFGPGNAWVTAAKMEVAMDPQGAAIDMPAGPSELLVIADAGATPAFVAADLLSQAEHGPDSQVLLFSDDAALLDAMPAAIERQLADLPRADIARRALANSRAIRFDSLDEAFAASNAYAPEHLILALRQPRDWLDQVASAGSVFLGDFTPESLGDYCSGTNHVLPTYGAARAYSGVSLASFQTFMTVQQASAEGLAAIGPDAATMARAERLEAHARAVTLRLARREAA